MFGFAMFLVVCLAAGLGCYWQGRRSHRRAGLLAGVLLALVCGKTVLHVMPHWEWALFPWTGYAYVQRLAMYPIAVGFFGLAAGCMPVVWNRAVVAAVGFAALVVGGVENTWMAVPTAHGSSTRYADAKHHTMQTTHFTCGPAAAVSAVSRCGVRISERDMAALCLTHDEGSRLFDLYRGVVLALGDRNHCVSIRDLDAEELLRFGRITIGANRGGGHALTFVGRGDHVIVHDPISGEPQRWVLDKLRKNQSGPVVVIEPWCDAPGSAASRPEDGVLAFLR